MSQHDYVIANDSGASVRADINSVLQAILSQNSGTSEPTSTSAGTFWLDTTGGVPYTLKIRDAGNNHWITLTSVNDPGSDSNAFLPAQINLPSSGGVFESDGSTEILTESSGTVSLKNTTLNSNNIFPSGHVIQTVSDTYVPTSPITVTTTSNDYLGSDLQVTITPKATGNKLLVTAFINDLYNFGATGRAIHAGFAFDANFSSGNGTTLGPRSAIADYNNYFSGVSGATLIINLQYSIEVTVGTNAPSAGSASIIRPIFQSVNGDCEIAANASSGLGVSTLTVMEIQA